MTEAAIIVREWRARAHQGKAAAYPAHFTHAVLPALKKIEGFVGTTLARHRLHDGRIEFVVLTHWRSMDAIRAFAGDDPARAVVDPAAVAALTDYDRAVRHYEVVADEKR